MAALEPYLGRGWRQGGGIGRLFHGFASSFRKFQGEQDEPLTLSQDLGGDKKLFSSFATGYSRPYDSFQAKPMAPL